MGAQRRTKEEIIEAIGKLSAAEIRQLMQDLAKKLPGLVDLAWVKAILQPPTPAPSAKVVPAQTKEALRVAKYNVFLVSVGEKKIQVIKLVWNLKPNLELREAKALVDAVGSGKRQVLAEEVDSDRAHEIIAELEVLGADAVMVETATSGEEMVSVYLTKMPEPEDVDYMRMVRAIEEHCGKTFSKADELFRALIFSKRELVADRITRARAQEMKEKLEAAGFGVEIV